MDCCKSISAGFRNRREVLGEKFCTKSIGGCFYGELELGLVDEKLELIADDGRHMRSTPLAPSGSQRRGRE